MDRMLTRGLNVRFASFITAISVAVILLAVHESSSSGILGNTAPTILSQPTTKIVFSKKTPSQVQVMNSIKEDEVKCVQKSTTFKIDLSLWQAEIHQTQRLLGIAIAKYDAIFYLFLRFVKYL
jgi:hypothetical protein